MRFVGAPFTAPNHGRDRRDDQTQQSNGWPMNAVGTVNRASTKQNAMTKNSTKTLMLIPVIAIAMIAGTASQAMAIEGNDEASVKVRAVEFKNQGFYEVRLLISSGKG